MSAHAHIFLGWTDKKWDGRVEDQASHLNPMVSESWASKRVHLKGTPDKWCDCSGSPKRLLKSFQAFFHWAINSLQQSWCWWDVAGEQLRLSRRSRNAGKLGCRSTLPRDSPSALRTPGPQADHGYYTAHTQVPRALESKTSIRVLCPPKTHFHPWIKGAD